MPIVPITLAMSAITAEAVSIPPGAGTFERDLADRVALQHHCVEGALDRRERMVAVDERRAHAHVDLVRRRATRRTDEPDHHVELARRGDVERIDRVDPDHVDVVRARSAS